MKVYGRLACEPQTYSGGRFSSTTGNTPTVAGYWEACSSREMFKFRVSKMPFPAFSAGYFSVSTLVVYFTHL